MKHLKIDNKYKKKIWRESNRSQSLSFDYLVLAANLYLNVKDPEHECEIVSDAERLELYNKSKNKYDQESFLNVAYSRKTHRKWCDIDNFGITHFGVHPTDLSREHIRFDVFHMRSAITRKLLNRFRSFMRK